LSRGLDVSLFSKEQEEELNLEKQIWKIRQAKKIPRKK
jgi:hypothetical protein